MVRCFTTPDTSCPMGTWGNGFASDTYFVELAIMVLQIPFSHVLVTQCPFLQVFEDEDGLGILIEGKN